jgi:hypothetical protein
MWCWLLNEWGQSSSGYISYATSLLLYYSLLHRWLKIIWVLTRTIEPIAFFLCFYSVFLAHGLVDRCRCVAWLWCTRHGKQQDILCFTSTKIILSFGAVWHHIWHWYEVSPISQYTRHQLYHSGKAVFWNFLLIPGLEWHQTSTFWTLVSELCARPCCLSWQA